MDNILLQSARVWTGTDPGSLTNGAVVVRGGRIVDVGPAARFGGASSLIRIELGDVTLMPGLIDSHLHLSGRAWIRHWLAPQQDAYRWNEARLAAAAEGFRRSQLLVRRIHEAGIPMLAVAGDPLRDITATQKIVGVWQNGRRLDQTRLARDGRRALAALSPAYDIAQPPFGIPGKKSKRPVI